MSEENCIIIKNPKIIDFFNNNKVLSCENFLLYYIDVFLSKNNLTDETVKISCEELNNIYDEYLAILSYKKNFEMINKEIKNICYKIKSPAIENTCSKFIKVKRELHYCENCGVSFSKIKGLTTHKRKCDKVYNIDKNKKENENIKTNSDVSEEEDDNYSEEEDNDNK